MSKGLTGWFIAPARRRRNKRPARPCSCPIVALRTSGRHACPCRQPSRIASFRRPSYVQQVILPKPTETGWLRRIHRAAAAGSLGTLRFWAITLPVPKGMIPKWHGGAGQALDHVKNRTVATADNDGFVTLCAGPLCLEARGAVLAVSITSTEAPCPRKHRQDATNIPTPGSLCAEARG